MTPPSSRPQGRRASLRDNRRLISVIGALVTTALVVGYVLIAFAYGQSTSTQFNEPTPPAGGVALVVAPEELIPVAGQVKTSLLLFPSNELTDENGHLTDKVVITAYPSSETAEIVYPADRVPAPKPLALPMAGIVQQYPFDTWTVKTTYRASIRDADGDRELPLTVSSFVRTPGWAFSLDRTTSTNTADTVTGAFARDFSTKGVALMFLTLMIVIAALVVRVVHSIARGRLELNMAVASWTTALLFALLPLRSAFPGSPPLGSWMDILVYFWVVAIVMVSVALTVSLLLMRARRANSCEST